MDTQLGLFPEAPHALHRPAVGPAEPSAELQRVATQLPREVRLGTSSWSFPGWHSMVYDRVASEAALAGDGLAAYAAHPLLRSVCIDRSFWFVEQDQAARVPTTYPIDLPMGPLAAYPTRFSRLRMTGSYLLILFAVAGLVITIRSLRKRFSSS
jgi:hypothetical protein